MDISTRQMRAFRLVSRHRNFTRAAEALFITPSGLSVLIRELENRVGFRLFDRTTCRVELTSHGMEPRSIRTGQPPDPVPRLLLGQLATDVAWAGKGIGTGLLKHALLRCIAASRSIKQSVAQRE